MPKFEREIEIDAPVEAVWALISTPDLWPQWLPGFGSVSNVSGMQPGGTFEWQAGEQTGTGSITEIEPNRLLSFITQVGDDQDGHTFEVAPRRRLFGLLAESGSQVSYTLDTMMRRGPLGDLIASGNPKDMLQVKQTLDRLRDLAEQGAS